MTITRRDGIATAIAGAGSSLLSACGGGSGYGGSSPPPPPPPPPPVVPPLKTSASAKGMRFGSTFNSAGVGQNAGSYNNSNYAALLEGQCQVVVPEWEAKWQALRPNATTFDFTLVDAMVNYVTSKGLAMRMHTLLWHRPEWMPAWAESYNYGATPATEARRLLADHIQTVLRRYSGKFTSIDVINEAIDTGTGGLMTTAMSRAFGSTEGFLDEAFKIARAEAPGVQLVYNDYMSWESWSATHRTGVLNLLTGFKNRGVPVDALGIQSHIGASSLGPNGKPPRDEVAWRKFLDDVVAMGYKLVITELDVGDSAFPSDISQRDAGVATLTRDYLDLMMSYPQLKDVLVWGMVDSFSWLQGFGGNRADGLAKRPCPYDSFYQPKPMRDAIGAAFDATTVRV